MYFLFKNKHNKLSPERIFKMHMSQSGVTQSERRFRKMMHSETPLKRLLNDLEQALKSKVGV